MLLPFVPYLQQLSVDSKVESGEFYASEVKYTAIREQIQFSIQFESNLSQE